ncbi:hypothetical protein DPEC_G00115900 [Dallia pectoralis]|uniref:Uncharacterized protein n=1 Tax=Dallia pectoralis TaxID=75939 RepID=A0ACC2GUZ9_DALPE|nr:hypothetical protein DPEC_G00115900 [Dallia pectoralis]
MEVECLTLRDLVSPKKSKADLEEVGGRHDQKENIFVEPRRSTPHKRDTTTFMPLNGKRIATPEHLHITPVKHSEQGAQPQPDPWSPTANLKMLISAASPDIRDRERKKLLFRPIENERAAEVEDVKAVDPCQCDALDDDEGVEEDECERKPSRKQKSLGLLCQKFLSLYPDYPTSDNISISLDKVATCLGVERRRIYDIINVLESLMIVGRVAKNQYVWHGRRRLGDTLAELQGLGRQQLYHLHMEQAGEGSPTEGAPAGTSDEGGDGDSSHIAAFRRKDKSLRIMSQKFVMLFLVSKTQMVTLDVAAKILIEESQDTANNSKYKTKVRRLYDIANVLTSLGLIRKVHIQDERGRKPAFKWIGPADFHSDHEGSKAVAATEPPETRPAASEPTVALGGRKQKPRHPSFDLASPTVVNQGRFSSAPSSPHRELTGLLPQPVDYSRKSVSISSGCSLPFGTATSDATRSSVGHQTPSQHGRNPPLAHPDHASLGINSEGPYSRVPTQHPPSQQLAYLPNLSQAVVMLYGGPPAPDGCDHHTEEVPKTPSSGVSVLGKRKREEENTGDKDDRGSTEMDLNEMSEGRSLGGNSVQMSPRPRSPGHREAAPRDAHGDRLSPGIDSAPPPHYLYLSNAAGLSALNFLLSAGQTPGSLALPAGTVPTLALPYVLVPSSLSHYPLLASGGDNHSNLNFNLSAIMSQARFVMGATGPYAVAGAPELAGFAVAPAHSVPEQPGLIGTGPVPPHSPLEPRAPVTFSKAQPQTPQNVKETAAGGGSKAFFQTPGTMETSACTPVVRRRGSAQRRLDIGHPPSS